MKRWLKRTEEKKKVKNKNKESLKKVKTNK